MQHTVTAKKPNSTAGRPPFKLTGKSYGSVDTLVRYTMPPSVQRQYKQLKEQDEATAPGRVRKRFAKAFARQLHGLWHIFSGAKHDIILGTGRTEKSAWVTAAILYNCK